MQKQQTVKTYLTKQDPGVGEELVCLLIIKIVLEEDPEYPISIKRV